MDVRSAHPDDIDAILRLLKVCMPNSPIPRSKEFWQWKHFRNPFGASPTLIAIHNKEIVGLRTFMRWLWKAKGKEWKAIRAVDTVTHPDHRGMRLFSKLTHQLLDQLQPEEISFVFNTPNQSSLPGYLKMGWQRVTRVPLLLRPLRPFQSLSRIVLRAKQLERQSSGSMQRLLQDPQLADFLVKVSNGDPRYQTVRSSDYLKWRYFEIPEIEYEALWSFEAQGSALLIYRQKIRRGFHELSLCELLVNPASPGNAAARKLLLDLIKHSRADYIVASAAADSPEMTVLRSCGFLPLPAFGPILTVKLLKEFNERTNPVHWRNWRASLGDLELF